MRHWVVWAALVWFVMAAVLYVGGLLGAVLIAAPLIVVFAYGPDWRAL